MTYSELEAFLTIVNYNSFSAAANALFITQPALSRKLGYLEKELGYRLFVRSKGNHNIYLTPEGNEFIHIAKELKRLMEISKSISAISTKKLDIAMAYPFTSTIWDNLLGSFIEAMHDSRISVAHTTPTQAYSLVENGTIDMAITVNPQHSVLSDTIPLISQSLFVLSSSKLSDDEFIDPSQLDASKEIFFPLSTDFINWHISKFGAAQTPKAFADNRNMLDKFLKKDDVWLFASPFLKQHVLSQHSFNVYGVKGDSPDITVYAVKSKYNQNPAVDTFIEHIKKSIEPDDGIKVLL